MSGDADHDAITEDNNTKVQVDVPLQDTDDNNTEGLLDVAQQDLDKLEIDEKDVETVVQFDPPLFIQRYLYVCKILRNHGIKSVVDFGSSEGKIAKHLRRVESLEKIILVDKDVETLQDCKRSLQPQVYNHIDRRKRPLTIEAYEGDLTVWDPCVADVQAVTLVEVIEHLVPEVLEKVPEAIFGRLQPDLVVMTTPNSEFNVLFPNFSGFRHWDHKFEWTREEFLQWCQQITSRYNYDVEFEGIGFSETSPDLGGCSQAAVFTKKAASEKHQQLAACGESSYKLLFSHDYPWEPPLPAHEALKNELEYYIPFMGQSRIQELREADWMDSCEVNLESLLKMPKIEQLCTSIEELRTFLEEHNYELTPDQTAVVYHEDDPDSPITTDDDYSDTQEEEMEETRQGDKSRCNDATQFEKDWGDTADVEEDWNEEMGDQENSKVEAWNLAAKDAERFTDVYGLFYEPLCSRLFSGADQTDPDETPYDPSHGSLWYNPYRLACTKLVFLNGKGHGKPNVYIL